MLFLSSEEEPVNEGGGILATQVQLRVACSWSLLISISYFSYVEIFGSMKEIQGEKCAQCLMATLQGK